MATQHGMAEPQARAENGALARGDGSDRSMADLAKQLMRECEALARAEAALVKTEFGEKIADAQRSMAALVTGGATLAGGLLVLLFAAVVALDRVLELWQAAVIVGGSVTVIGAIMLASGKRGMSAQQLKPERTIEEIEQATGFSKEHAR
jgi:hypothetical protein